MKSKNVSLAVEIYPREGTETVAGFLVAICALVEIYPREGTETTYTGQFLPIWWVEIYPREGTETFSRLFQTPNWLKFIPVRGRKLIRLKIVFM